MIYVFTGNGKGKTTSAMGLGLRAVGGGKKVLMIQFLKTDDTSEVAAIKKHLKGRFTIKSFGRKGFPNPKIGFIQKDFDLASKAFLLAKKEITNRKYDVVILDEINVAVDYGLIKITDMLNLINKFPKSKALVLTGRNAHGKITKKADLVTEMKEIKHPFKKGIVAKKGIEY